MGYYVGAISSNNRWVSIDTQTPSGLTNIFKIQNKGAALIFSITKYFRSSYELPQGSILARIYINERLVVEDVPVLDRFMVDYPNTHGWVIEYDIGASDLDKLSGGTPLLIEQTYVSFYVNEDGLRTVEVEERNRTNAFDFFKQQIGTNALVGSVHVFTYAKGIKHDFTTNEPFEGFVYNSIDMLNYGPEVMSGVRIVITPLIDPKSFALSRLFEIDIRYAKFDAYGVYQQNETPTPAYSFTLSGMQLSLAYKNEFQKQELTVGPITYGESSTYMAKPAVLDELPATSYANHELSLDPNGAKGFYFLDAATGRVGFSSDLLVQQMVLQLSLSAYFSVTRDVTAELLIEAHSDLSVADALAVA